MLIIYVLTDGASDQFAHTVTVIMRIIIISLPTFISYAVYNYIML